MLVAYVDDDFGEADVSAVAALVAELGTAARWSAGPPLLIDEREESQPGETEESHPAAPGNVADEPLGAHPDGHDDDQDEDRGDKDEDHVHGLDAEEPVRTVGVLLPIARASAEPTTAHELELFFAAIVRLSRERDLDFELEWNDRYVGVIESGVFDEADRQRLLSEL